MEGALIAWKSVILRGGAAWHNTAYGGYAGVGAGFSTSVIDLQTDSCSTTAQLTFSYQLCRYLELYRQAYTFSDTYADFSPLSPWSLEKRPQPRRHSGGEILDRPIV